MRRIPEVFGRKNLLLMGVQGFYWCAYCTYFGFLVLYMQNHGYSNVQCAQAQVLIAVATLITQPLIGYLTDSFITCKKFLLVTTALAVPVAFLLQASVSSPILCYGAIVLQSILFYPAAPGDRRHIACRVSRSFADRFLDNGLAGKRFSGTISFDTQRRVSSVCFNGVGFWKCDCGLG